MKKVSLVLGVLFLMTLALSSCKKEYTCTCTMSGVSTDFTIAKTTKSDAKTKCESLNVVGVTTGCALK